MADAKLGNQSPSLGRFQAIHTFCTHTAVNLKSATGDLASWVVMHENIRILRVGWIVTTALGGATTINAIAQWEKGLKNNGARAILNALATLTFDGTNNVLRSEQDVALDTGVSGTPLAGPQAYPTAQRGDVIYLNLTTQGTGAAAQSVVPFILYQERPSTS